jgi:uncharacterized iron-regulated membrane protein
MNREAVRGDSVHRRTGICVATMLMLLGLTACGSGGKKSSNATPTPTPTAAAGTATPAKGPVDRRPVAVQVRVPGKSDFADVAEAKPGDYVQLRALVRIAADAPPRKLTISVARRSAGDLKVRARPSSGGKGSTATVRGASGKKLRLTDLRYSCFAPPAVTFCPLSSVKAAPDRYVVKAKVGRGSPVLLTFTARSG